MSGVTRLANAVANDPSFAKQAGMSVTEADQFVPCSYRNGRDNGSKNQLEMMKRPKAKPYAT